MDRVGHVVRIRSLAAAQQVLRERRRTRQAGFTAEYVPQGVLRHHPILFSDGPLHDEQRRKVARFFAPTVVADRHTGVMQEVAERLLCHAGRAGGCDLAELALLYSVSVSAEVIGLTASPVAAMARRLVTFFNQPPFDITKPDLGRTRGQWAMAAVRGLLPVARFYLRDVRPAIRDHRQRPRDDVISHLITEEYTNADIAIECVTFGTAGMVTTREYICMAAWHLLDDARLRTTYLTAEQPGRLAILREVIRLEPVVGHLYRRVTEPFGVHDGEETLALEPGDLVDICVRDTNADPVAVGEDPLGLRPGRVLEAGIDGAGLAFGDGAHKCPGQPLALLEADALLVRLLALDPVVTAEPTVGWDDLVAGYTLRGFTVRFPSGEGVV